MHKYCETERVPSNSKLIWLCRNTLYYGGKALSAKIKVTNLNLIFNLILEGVQFLPVAEPIIRDNMDQVSHTIRTIFDKRGQIVLICYQILLKSRELKCKL